MSNIFKVKLCIFVSVLQFLNLSNCHAAEKTYVVDVFGTNEISSEYIASHYKKELSIIANTSISGVIFHSKQDEKKFTDALTKLRDELSRTPHYILGRIDPVTYTHASNVWITFSYIKPDEAAKIKSKFIPKQTQSIADKGRLIPQWNEYKDKVAKLILNEKVNLKDEPCPAHHCMGGFAHPQLIGYVAIFNEAEQYKSNLVNILQHDKDENKRATAVFLLAHIKDKNELIKMISPSMMDSSAFVRNSVARVLISITKNDNHASLPLDQLFLMTGFPVVGDRNNALYIVSKIANDRSKAALIKNSIGPQLLANLKLQQPDNHDFAYDILKKISGKNYSDRDYQAWEAWLKLRAAR